MLGYEKVELIGNKVIRVIPNIYHDIHDGFIMNFLKNVKASTHPSQKIVFALKKDGKMVEVFLAVKIIPHEEKGFLLAGFMKKDLEEQESYIMINKKNMLIEGISEEFSNTL